MKWVKLIGWLGLIAMSCALVYGFSSGKFVEDGAALLQNPWGIVSMVDLYTGFVLFSAWIVYREKKALHALVWVFFMMVLGFFTGALYTLYAAYTSKEDWQVFWMGKYARD